VADYPLQLTDRPFHPYEYRSADHTVPDIEFFDLWYPRNGRDILVGQAMAGVDSEAERVGECRSAPDSLHLVGEPCCRIRTGVPPRPSLRVLAGMEFDRVGAESGRD